MKLIFIDRPTDRPTISTRAHVWTAKEKSDKLYEVMKIGPDYYKFKSVTEAEVVEQSDHGGCVVCEQRFYAEPNPLAYPSCRTCNNRPSFHHGRCCPEKLRQRERKGERDRLLRKWGEESQESQSSRPMEQDAEVVNFGPQFTNQYSETEETQEESPERPARRRRVDVCEQED